MFGLQNTWPQNLAPWPYEGLGTARKSRRVTPCPECNPHVWLCALRGVTASAIRLRQITQIISGYVSHSYRLDYGFERWSRHHFGYLSNACSFYLCDVCRVNPAGRRFNQCRQRAENLETENVVSPSRKLKQKFQAKKDPFNTLLA